MTKSEIYDHFDHKISKIAIVERDGNYVIQGKWSIIELVGDLWDIFLCNPKDMRAGLGTGLLNNRIRDFQGAQAGQWARLDGEAYMQVSDINLILNNLDLLGIRKKRQISDEQRQTMIKRLRA